MTTMLNFNEAIAAIPYEPQQNAASGILPSIMRASGHILYIVGALAEPGYTLEFEETARELRHAQDHLSHTLATAAVAPLSAAAKEHISAFVTAVVYANDEYEQWTDEDRGPNLKALADRCAALAAFLDLELTGVRASDPGRTL